MKQIFLSIFLIAAIISSGQKVAKVTLTTSASLPAAFEAFRSAGKEAKYGSRDMDTSKGTITLWQQYYGGNGKELQIQVTAKYENGRTTATLVMPHMPNTFGSYVKEIKKFTGRLSGKLPDLQFGEFTDGIE
jgi:hypothetical protein